MADYCRFPDGFLWGCATASFQVEGAAREDGRAPSVWDTFCRTPGRVQMDHTGDVACDQYHRFREDIALMKWLGVKAYRFSVAWPRVFPDGDGEPNAKGLDYYDRLVDALVAAGIEPWMTLFHWDLPQALEDRFGGWRSPETARRFGDYAACVTKRLSDRVRRYFTINEFLCFTDLGYSTGNHAPGLKLSDKIRNQTRHHGLLAHGLAVQAIRAGARTAPSVGLAENANVCVPVIETAEHIAAARTAMRETNAPFLTAALEGAYTEAYLREQGANAPAFTEAEMKVIGSPLDFVGLNMYAPVYIRAAPGEPHGFAAVPHPESYPRMNMPWLYFCPQILYWGPRLVRDIWGVRELYVTENGCASTDTLAPDKEVYDTDRLMYLRNHLIALHRAVAEGVPLKGYFAWSLMDNFEWGYGYSQRFGLTHIDYATQERTLKASGEWYRDTFGRAQ